MTDYEDFAEMVVQLEDKAMALRAHALRKAAEEELGYRAQVYGHMMKLLDDGANISELAEATGKARSTLYRWREEYRRMKPMISRGGMEPDVWVSAKRSKITGEVIIESKSGDTWVLSEDGEAWNKLTDDVLYGFENWPVGLKEQFDLVPK